VEADTRLGGGVKGTAPYMGMMVSEPALFMTCDKSTSYARYITGRIYASDNRGNIFAAFLEEADPSGGVRHLDPGRWTIRTVATLQDSLSSALSGGGNYAAPHGLVLKNERGSIWIAGGTANVAAKKRDAQDPGVVSNDLQMIFAFKTDDARRAPLTRGDLQELEKSPQKYDSFMTGEGKGWYIKLDRIRGFDEYVSAKPMLVGNTLLVSTFTTTKFDIDGATDICKASKRSVSGYSRIYALDIRDGSANLWVSPDPGRQAKYIQMDGVRITGFTKVTYNGGTSVLASFDNLNDGKLPGIAQEKAKYIEGFDALRIALPGNASKINLPPGSGVILYWRRHHI
jgi:uncharacterized Fe-S cluster protein YjdI